MPRPGCWAFTATARPTTLLADFSCSPRAVSPYGAKNGILTFKLLHNAESRCDIRISLLSVRDRLKDARLQRLTMFGFPPINKITPKIDLGLGIRQFRVKFIHLKGYC